MTVTVCDIEYGPVEIVDLPSYNMVILHSYVHVYQRVHRLLCIVNTLGKISWHLYK